MRNRIHKKRIPTRPRRAETRGFRYDERRRGAQSRKFAKPERPLGLCPEDSCRATYADLR